MYTCPSASVSWLPLIAGQVRVDNGDAVLDTLLITFRALEGMLDVLNIMLGAPEEVPVGGLSAAAEEVGGNDFRTLLAATEDVPAAALVLANPGNSEARTAASTPSPADVP